MADTRAAQLEEIGRLQQEIQKLQTQQDAKQEREDAIPAWLQARRWLVNRGLSKLPSSPKKLLAVFEQSDSLRRQFCTSEPKLAAELKLTDDDIELPTVVLDLLSDPSIEPTVALGRRLLDSGSIDDLISMAPQRRTTIQLSVKAWKEDQQRKMQQGIDATHQAAVKGREADQKRIREHGNPMVRSAAENVELRKRQILRDAGLKVGYRQ